MNIIISIFKKIDTFICNTGEKIFMILDSDAFGNTIISLAIIGLVLQMIRAYFQ